eukprot:CAMPEP_0196724478 /NCGR_PEP_ID=MMETSP1091-20130531/6309_1 /TAXON_ID=302021 /ORGANISM="Rhodomonas sp., Strain CCMP768" /LENGTH=128 /DNA_ID=CAMNT_0042066599 /DNA_START=38 /DNA_END=424 /DNA_ORIENTATION=-
MPTVTVDTSAEITREAALVFIAAATKGLSEATGAIEGHIHIQLRESQLMTWGGKAGGLDGAPHTAQIRVLTAGPALDAGKKNAIVSALLTPLASHVPKASSQVHFSSCELDCLAIDGLLLPDLIARDS